MAIRDLYAIFDGIVTSSDDPDQLSNCTIQALNIVELLDRVLINYGDAYEIIAWFCGLSVIHLCKSPSMVSASYYICSTFYKKRTKHIFK